jgi:hypothetical protein
LAPYSTTFQEMQNAIIAKINLDATADLQAVKDWINWAITDVAMDSEAIEATTFRTLDVGTALISFTQIASGNIQRLKEMWIVSGGQPGPPLQQISLKDIIRLRTGTGGVAPSPGVPTRYAIAGGGNIELWPTPAVADTIYFYYTYLPSELSGNSETIPFGEPWSKMIENGALAEAANFLGDPGEDEYQQKYQQWKARYKAHLNRVRGTQFPRLGGDYYERWPVSDRSADIRW